MRRRRFPKCQLFNAAMAEGSRIGNPDEFDEDLFLDDDQPIGRPTRAATIFASDGCKALTAIHLRSLSFEFNTRTSFNRDARFDEYVSDPMKPVPYRPQPIIVDDWEGFDNWLVLAKRFADHRPDVLTYVTEELTEPLRVSGVPAVKSIRFCQRD